MLRRAWIGALLLCFARDAVAHEKQFGVHAQPGVGYRVLFMYEGKGDYCGQSGTSVCDGRAPGFLELGLSYGVTRAVELIADLRLGLEKDFAPPGQSGPTPRARVFAPGAKIYVDDTGTWKFFSTLQVALDFTDFSANGVSAGTDVGVRNVNGLQLDFDKTLGVYVHVGETIGFVRWLRFEIDAGLGLQARFP